MANIANSVQEIKLAELSERCPHLIAFILEGRNLDFLEHIIIHIDDVQLIPKANRRRVSKIVKLGRKEPISRSDLQTAYCLGLEDICRGLVKMMKAKKGNNPLYGSTTSK